MGDENGRTRRDKKSLATIERLIQQLPEVMAATYIQMNEEYEAARMQGKAAQIFGKLLL